MNVSIPSPSVFTLRGVLADRICHLWPLRNSDNRNLRDYARATLRQFISILRQIS